MTREELGDRGKGEERLERRRRRRAKGIKS